MYRIDITNGAEDDFRYLLQHDHEAGAIIHAVLEQIQQDHAESPQELLQMNDRRITFGRFSIKFFQDAYDLDGLRLWSIKAYLDDTDETGTKQQEAVDFRVFLAPCHKRKRYYILGIVKRSSCYKTNGGKYERIKSDYERYECHL